MTQPPRVDLFDPTFKADPYPTYSELRTSAPVHRITLRTEGVCGWSRATTTSWPSSRTGVS
jgi:hypothetical protein